MTIDEAIKNLSIQLEVKRRLGIFHQADAIKLGIEALKLVGNLRFEGSPFYPKPLPGEPEGEEGRVEEG